MKIKYFLLYIILTCIVPTPRLYAQNGTLYFMDDVPAKNGLNPAFIPDSKWYLDFIVLPDFHAQAGNNAFSVKNAIFNKDGQAITALHPSQDIDHFYRRVRRVNSFNTSLGLNLLSFGFSHEEKNYFTFNAGIRASARANLPRDLFKLALYGTPDESGDNNFNLTKTGLEATVYSELGFGYMRQLNSEWTVGGRFKYLMGYAAIHSRNKSMRLNANQEAWNIESNADIYGSLPVDYQTKEDGNIDFDSFSAWSAGEYAKMLLRPAGKGMAIDLGVTWQPVEHITVSAALTDLGFIHWKKNLLQGGMHGLHKYTGIDYHKGDSINWGKIGDEFVKAFQFGSSAGAPFSQRLTANMHIGAEYAVLNNRISFGALSRTMMHTSHLSQEMILVTNFRPADWFKAHLSYSFLNGGGNTIGLGMKFHFGAVHTYFLTDYIPFRWAKLTSGDNGQTTTLPYNTRRLNLQIGTALTFGKRCD